MRGPANSSGFMTHVENAYRATRSRTRSLPRSRKDDLDIVPRRKLLSDEGSRRFRRVSEGTLLNSSAAQSSNMQRETRTSASEQLYDNINIIAFNRPAYFEEVLKSIVDQKVDYTAKSVHIWIDGYREFIRRGKRQA